MSGTGVLALEKPCLGRPFRLGMLYDCRRDSLIPGVTLWNAETLNKDVNRKSQETSDFEVIAEDSLSSKSFQLDVDAGLKLSLLGGLVHVEGAAKFLKDQKSSKHQARVSLKYKSTSSFEQLTMRQLGKFEYQDVFDRDIATHVVTAILYGADAFFVFDREVSCDENIKKVQGNLEVKIGGLPGLKNLAIGGEGKVTINTCDKNEEEKLKCKFYGDLILPKQPATFQDAAKLYQELPGLLKGKSVPKKVWLYTLGELDTKALRMVREISTTLVDDVVAVMEGLRVCEMRCNDLVNSDVCTLFVGIKDQVETTKRAITSYRVGLEKKLSTLLPEIRGCTKEDAELYELLEDNYGSPFSRQSLEKWMTGKEKEVNMLTMYLDLLKKQPKIQLVFEPGELDMMTAGLEIDTILCFDFNITGQTDAQVMRLEAYASKKVIKQENDASSKWYNDRSVLSELRSQLRLFLDFVSANADRDDVKYVLVNGDSEVACNNDKVPLVSLYENGVSSEFMVPGQPGKPKVSKVTSNGIQLIWDKPKGVDSINSYTVLYKQQDSDDWLSQSTSGCQEEAKLNDLTPERVYLAKVRGCTAGGVSPDSPLSDPIKLRVSRVGRMLDHVLADCTEINTQGSPALYQLPTHELMKKDGIAKVSVGRYYPVPYPVTVVPHRVILLIGPGGSGKTTLLNGIANHLMGVHFEDDVRLQIAEISKTDSTTAYTFKRGEGSPIQFDLTVIDTPGFGDSEEQNKQFVSQIEHMFSEIIGQLHAIGLVIDASRTTITPSQQFVLNAISRMTSSDVLVLATHADARHQPPDVLSAISNARLRYKDYFEFDNSSFIKTQPTDHDLLKLWEMSTKSFETLFTDLAKKKPWSKKLTEGELLEMQQIEAVVGGAYPLLRALLSKMDQISLLIEAAMAMEADPECLNRTVTIIGTKHKIVDLVPFGFRATSCSKCKITCHSLCRVTDDDTIFNCMAMTDRYGTDEYGTEDADGYGTEGAECGVCQLFDSNCSLSDHNSNSYRFEMYQVTKTRTFQEMKDLEESSETEIKNFFDVEDIDEDTFLYKLYKFAEDDDDHIFEHTFYAVTSKMRLCLNRLHEIIGSPLSCTCEEFIQRLIENERREGSLGWEGRVRALKSIPPNND